MIEEFEVEILKNFFRKMSNRSLWAHACRLQANGVALGSIGGGVERLSGLGVSK